MNTSKVVAQLAETSGLMRPQVRTLLEELAKLAYVEAKNGFVIPGIGKLVLVQRAARMGRNPATGESVQIPAKTVVKFRLLKACKQAVLGA